MKKTTRWVGLDVHAETIAVAVAEAEGSVRSLGTIANTPDAVRKFVKKLGDITTTVFCYEAGPCGYELYWQLEKLGSHCFVIAPTLIPKMAGDRVKTDRRDAEKLARLFRSGDLTPVWVPSREHEALRDLVRAREVAKKDELRARHRLTKFLLRQGKRREQKMRAWGTNHQKWLQSLGFEYAAHTAVFLDYRNEVDRAAERIVRLEKAIDEAIATMPAEFKALVEGLQAMRGIAKTTAVTLVAEVGHFSRFERPNALMAYSGIVSSEHSSGGKDRRGAITKTGNAHLRRVLCESAWSYRHRPAVIGDLKRRQEGQSAETCAIAWKAQHRLHKRYATLAARGKPLPKVLTAVARELIGFVWAVAVDIEAQQRRTKRAA